MHERAFLSLRDELGDDDDDGNECWSLVSKQSLRDLTQSSSEISLTNIKTRGGQLGNQHHMMKKTYRRNANTMKFKKMWTYNVLYPNMSRKTRYVPKKYRKYHLSNPWYRHVTDDDFEADLKRVATIDGLISTSVHSDKYGSNFYSIKDKGNEINFRSLFAC